MIRRGLAALGAALVLTGAGAVVPTVAHAKDDPPSKEEQGAGFRDFARCMREEGIENEPDRRGTYRFLSSGDPEAFRKLLDQRIEDTPQLFPPEIRRGYRMKDTYPSRKTGQKLRRIELRDRQCYLVRPCFLMPYLSGHAEDVQAPLFSASSPSPSGR